MSVRINVPWHREPAYFDGAAWHKTIAQAGGGTLITQGSHFLDVALWALNEKPTSAMGYTATPGFDVQVETLAHGIVETSGGTLISITSTLAAASEQAVTIEMYGEKGTAVYTDRPIPHVKFMGVKIHQRTPARVGRACLAEEPGRICQVGAERQTLPDSGGQHTARAGGGGCNLSLGAVGPA